MSVIIRLQNLPWSANALDIRQFFRGLSIPEGGVHIVGGEMGDAFIAFSTDEDARQAMMHDREAINGVQIRLLLSSRAEMQKVIETARQQSLLALKKASGLALAKPKVPSSGSVAITTKKTVASSVPQPPVITASSFKNILSHSGATVTPSFLAYQQQAGFTLISESTKNNNDSDDSESRRSRERDRSDSREIRRSRSRSKDRNSDRKRPERSSRDRSRERDYTNGKRSSRHRSHSRERNRTISRERDRSREGDRLRNNNRNSDRNNREGINNSRPRNVDADVKYKSNILPWSSTNSYKTNFTSSETVQTTVNSIKPVAAMSPSVAAVSVTSTFQNYNVTTQSLTALNNYSLSGIIGGSSIDSFKGFALKNPYTTAKNSPTSSSKESSLPTTTTSSSAIPGIFLENKSSEAIVSAPIVDTAVSLPQEPIAFANVNPYEKMYPNLFAQAAALSCGQKTISTKPASTSGLPNSTNAEEGGPKDVDPNETNCIKISNMCPRTNYSDLRKFFVGLFIPHNGIKMLNDKHGLRVGIAYVQFTRQSSVTKALCRKNNLFKGRSVMIEAVSEQEFIDAEDSFRPANPDKAYSHRSNDSDNENSESGSHGMNSSGFSSLSSYKKVIQLEPFNVLYIEDIPSLATEQDIMKMFNSYSLYDILLIASPENRREFVAHVRFSREEDAKAAYEDRAHHQIGYRRVRIRPGSVEEMENAKEKIRLANEQLMKEEKAAEEEETKRKLEKLITDHITQEENRHQNIVSMDLTEEDDDNYNENEIANAHPGSKNYDGDMDEDAENLNNYDSRKSDNFSMKNQLNRFNMNLDPRRPQTPGVPSLFDLDPMLTSNVRNQNRSNLYNDPRLRNMSDRVADSSANSIDNNQNHPTMTGNNFNTNLPIIINNTEKNFVILKNCDYNTRINDVAQLLLTANLALKHIEPLHNERELPTGEFIVEFRRPSDAEISIERFHNIQFRNRSLRVFPITPQEIADRLGKPFLSYIPGGNGIRISKNVGIDGTGRSNLNLSNNIINNNSARFGNNSPQNTNANNIRSNNPFNDSGPLSNNNNNIGRNNIVNNNSSKASGGTGIPEKFNSPGCILALENVPYKAEISDILRFFQGFDLTPDDIIRRFNDDGLPTGDARIAFTSPDQAMSAYQSRKRKQIFGRNIFIKII